MVFLLCLLAAFAALASGTAARDAHPNIRTGIYAGICAGCGQSSWSVEDIDAPVKPSGAVGGLHAGHNAQSSVQVVSPEVDHRFSRLSQKPLGGGDEATVSCRSNPPFNFQGMVRNVGVRALLPGAQSPHSVPRNFHF
jgi:hypothetical protein